MLEIRRLTTRAEIESCIRQTIGVYRPDANIDADASVQMHELDAHPEPEKDGRWAAFLDGEMVAGYRLQDRFMQLGPARLRTACIGAVYTRPEFRNQGLARALMLDAIDHAATSGYDLLLLAGIRNLYHKFGFADMHAVTRVMIPVDELTGIETNGWSTRTAMVEDADLLLDLYNRSCGSYGGRFERSLAMQRFGLRFLRSTRSFVLAVDPIGIPRGYIILDETRRDHSGEAVADSWPAMAALLSHHAGFAAAADEPPKEIGWALPPDSSMTTELIRRFSLQRMTNHIHHGGWMARAANEAQLMHSLVPLWQEKLVKARSDWSGTLDLRLEDCCWQLDFDSDGLSVRACIELPDKAVVLAAQQFIQLIFAYPLPLAAADDAFDHLASPTQESLSTIFGQTPFWIAGSDAF